MSKSNEAYQDIYVEEVDLKLAEEEHDCHLDPEDGCRGCEQIRKNLDYHNRYNLKNHTPGIQGSLDE